MIFVGLGGLVLFYPEALISVVVRNETFIRIVGTVSLTYFSLIFLLSLKVYFRKVTLVITAKEIIDNSNALSIGKEFYKEIAFKTTE